MKRITAVFLAFLIFLSFNVYADSGNIYISDVKTFINYLWIESYNLDGTTAVMVRNLENYGYDIDWNEKTETVKVTFNGEKEITPHAPQYYPPHEIGILRFKTYPSNIKVYFEGKEIPSVNIGGRTAIKLRDMDIENNIRYDSKKKEAYIRIGCEALSGKKLEYINIFYEVLAQIVRGDYERIRIEAMIVSGAYDNKTMGDFKAYTEDLTSLMDGYKEYTEPQGFSESSMELWWAAVNSRYASCSMYDIGTNFKNKKDNPMLSLYVQQYKEDSAYQRDNAMALLSKELYPQIAKENEN